MKKFKIVPKKTEETKKKKFKIVPKKPKAPTRINQPETEIKKAKKFREEMDKIKKLIPLSKNKDDGDAGAGAGAGSSATYDRTELKNEIQKLRIKLILADNNVKVGNVVGGRHDAYKIIKITPVNITYERVGYRARNNDLYTFGSDDAKKPWNVGETKISVYEFITENLDMGSLAITQYNSR